MCSAPEEWCTFAFPMKKPVHQFDLVSPSDRNDPALLPGKNSVGTLPVPTPIAILDSQKYQFAWRFGMRAESFRSFDQPACVFRSGQYQIGSGSRFLRNLIVSVSRPSTCSSV